MRLAVQIFIAISLALVLVCEGIFIPFKRSFSTDPDASRNVVSRIHHSICLATQSFIFTLKILFLLIGHNISDLIY